MLNYLINTNLITIDIIKISLVLIMNNYICVLLPLMPIPIDGYTFNILDVICRQFSHLIIDIHTNT